MQSTETCVADGCDDAVHARQRCRRHYRSAHRAGELPPLSNPHHHKLVNVDVEARTATCSICGPTEIRYRPNDGARQCIVVARRRWDGGRKSPAAARDAWLKHRYGITADEYDELLRSQDGGCGICGGQSTQGRRLAVDHDHSSGRVRGLLCSSCNVAIGALGDDLTSVLRAVRYLEG